MIYAIDTDILIHLLSKKDNSVKVRRDDAVASGIRFTVPRVVDYEIQRGFLCNPSPMKEVMYRAFIDHYGVGEITNEIWYKAAHLYAEMHRKNFDVGDADILIAAFCIVNNYTLVTNNSKHFKIFDELSIENWVD